MECYKPKLGIDIETFCELDIKKVGAYKYISHPSFEILLFAYAFDDEEAEVIDLVNGEKIPQRVINAILSNSSIKCAYNDNFERLSLSRYLDRDIFKNPLDVRQWEDTMVKALVLGLPGSLKMACEALGFGKEGKMEEGKRLINYFCKPCKPTKANGGRTRNYPWHDPEGWEVFKKYNKRDVEVERRVRKIADNYPLLEEEWEIRNLDQDINDRGIKIDTALVESAIKTSADYTNTLKERAKELTSLENPNSLVQLKKWVSDELGEEIDTLRKDDVAALLKRDNLPDNVREMLEIRQKLGKTSIKKYEKMLDCMCSDGRAHGILQFYGANRTGRWAGRLIQVQNLPQNKLDDIAHAKNLRVNRNTEQIEKEYNSLPFVLSQLVRTALIPKEGSIFAVADFSAIEARVLRWIAQEEWRMEVFRENGDIYCSSASKMFHVPVVKHGINGHLRQRGKIAELALGYGGAVGALKSMDRDKAIDENEMPGLVKTWRGANPNVTAFWWDVDKAARLCIKGRRTVRLPKYNLEFEIIKGVMRIKLPSGRKLTYCKPRIEIEPGFNRESITYFGVNQTTKKWEKQYTYGPKLVENIVQGIARDCLRDAMLNVAKREYKIVMHVHDEIIAEVPRDSNLTLEKMIDLMCIVPDWAKGLPLKADGYYCDFYMKD